VASTPLNLDSRLCVLPGLDEARWKRRVFLGLALAVALGFFLVVRTYLCAAPGSPGIDENAYLVAGKNFARHLTTGFKPATPYAFVGPMWDRTADGWYYPKYPLGVPVLNAIAIWLGGGHHNACAFYTSPVCAALAVLAMFLMTRAVAGSFLALLAEIALASNSTMLHLAIIPSSHAPAIVFALWGMFCLLCWWRSGNRWMGMAAGFLLGATATMRYSEGLLLAPLGIVTLTTIRWTRWRSYVRAALPVLAWAVPVVAMVIFNRVTMGHWTGYDSSHESTGFTVKEFKSKWEFTIQELYLYGLFFVLPVGLLGMLLMFGRVWRIGLLMTLWFVPGALLYTSYYWGEQSPGVGYLRFFLTLYPPVVISAMWLLSMAAQGVMQQVDAAGAVLRRRGSVSVPLAAGLFAAAVGAVGLYVELPDMERQYAYDENLAYSAQTFLAAVPAARHQAGQPEPLLFADDGGMFSRLLMHMQFAADGEWYATGAFAAGGARGMMGGMSRRLGQTAPNQADPPPTPIQPERVEYMKQVYGTMTQADLKKEETRVLGEALDAGRPVYALVSVDTAADFRRQMLADGFECQALATWQEPVNTAMTADSTAPPPDAAPGMADLFGGGRRGGGRGGFGGPGPGGGPGGFGGPGGGAAGGRPGGRFGGAANGANGALSPAGRGMGIGLSPQKLQVIQVTRRPALAGRPSTRPTS